MMEKFEGCPGSRMMNFKSSNEKNSEAIVKKIKSQLTQWPIQMHLINPAAPYYQGADVLLTADCVAYALGDFHRDVGDRATSVEGGSYDRNKNFPGHVTGLPLKCAPIVQV